MRTPALIAGALLATTLPAAAQDSFGGGQKTPAPPSAFPANPPEATQPAAGGSDAQSQAERQDFGVPPTSELHTGAMHAPTPASIPGGQVVTTRGVVELVAGRPVRALIFDILGGPEQLPGAILAVPAAQPGTFSDRTQQEFGNFLAQMTQGNKETPLVFYCLSSHCWMSYNASLRAINMGYRNVLWYRGGIEAWKAAGQPVQKAGAGGQNQ